MYVECTETVNNKVSGTPITRHPSNRNCYRIYVCIYIYTTWILQCMFEDADDVADVALVFVAVVLVAVADVVVGATTVAINCFGHRWWLV